MRIFVVADSPHHETGYAQVGRSLCSRLVKDGHEVFLYGPGGFCCGKFLYTHKNGSSWWVLGGMFGDDRAGSNGLPYWLEEVAPDLMITLLDPGVLDLYGLSNVTTWFWAPIDTWPINNMETGILGRADKVLVPSRWGLEQLNQVGLNGVHVPYGIENTETYFDQAARDSFRSSLGIDDNTFLVGMVGMHYPFPDRKGYPYGFEAIKNLANNHDNVKAYIQVELKTGQENYFDLEGLRDTMGLQGILGFSRPLGPRYLTPDEMRARFSAFDVLLQSSMTEGFGLPVVEAQATGTPVVLNSATALTELAGPLALACSPAGAMICPDGTLISIPDVNSLSQGLEMAYEDWTNGADKVQRINTWARDRYDWDKLYETFWRPLLEDVSMPVDITGVTPRLNLGCGMKPRENAVNHDLSIHSDFVDVAHDLNVFPYPWEDNEFGAIECIDVLEHLDCSVIDFMDECWRILRPGGHVIIITVENGSWQHITDPTHKRGFVVNSLDYFDDNTILGKDYGPAYTSKRWKIEKKGTTPEGELIFMLQKIDNE